MSKEEQAKHKEETHKKFQALRKKYGINKTTRRNKKTDDDKKPEVQPEVDATKADENKDVHLNKDSKTGDDTSKSTAPEITDDSVFQFASERLGREVKSWDDFMTEKEVVKEVEVVKEKDYLTDFGKGYEKFYHDTGRSAQDYLRSMEDLSQKSEEDVIKASLAFL